MIGYDRLKVKSPYTIQHIRQLAMSWKPGEHGHLSLHALLQDTTTDHAAVEAAWQETITLYEDDGQQKATLFKGLITSVKITHTQGVYMLELEAKSSSIKLDIQKKRRSFQNTSQTYGALLSEVSSAYDGADVSCLIGDDVSISSPIVQYEETDWELMKRLASEFHSFVVCDILEETPKLYFGIPQGKERNAEQEVSYRASKDLIAYQQAGGAEAGLHDTDFFSYDISSKEVYAIGDRVQFRNKQMIVKEVSAQMVQGELQYEYRLVREDGLRQGIIHNAKLAGISLEGEILAVQGEQVKLKLDIDNKQPSSTAYWYPFAPTTGSMMYCMPQIGTKASLYLPEASGKGAIVIGSVRKNGDSSEKTGDPSTRYFGNEHGSELKLAPKVVAFAGASEDPLTFTLDDDLGISMISPTRLSLDATLDLTLYTPKRVLIKTTSQIIAKKKNADIGMSVESEYHLLGTAVALKGADRTTYPPYDDAPTVTEPDPKPPFNWKKLALNVLGGLAVVAQ
ncbi:phage late control protein GPD [compost metagenome]